MTTSPSLVYPWANDAGAMRDCEEDGGDANSKSDAETVNLLRNQSVNEKWNRVLGNVTRIRPRSVEISRRQLVLDSNSAPSSPVPFVALKESKPAKQHSTSPPTSTTTRFVKSASFSMSPKKIIQRLNRSLSRSASDVAASFDFVCIRLMHDYMAENSIWQEFHLLKSTVDDAFRALLQLASAKNFDTFGTRTANADLDSVGDAKVQQARLRVCWFFRDPKKPRTSRNDVSTLSIDDCGKFFHCVAKTKAPEGWTIYVIAPPAIE